MPENLKGAFLNALKTLLVIYCLLAVVFLAGRAVAGRLPAPYNLRIIPSEITPWLR